MTPENIKTMQHAVAASLIQARLAGIDPLAGLGLSDAEAAAMLPALLDVAVAALTELLSEDAETYAQEMATDLMSGATLELPGA
jgi:hypothetical protein